MSIEDFKPGLYRHYKGGFYTAHCLVTHHETRQPMVLYTSHQYGGFNVRPLQGWIESPQSTCEDRDGWNDEVARVGRLVDGVMVKPRHPLALKVRRFTFVGDLPSDVKITER